MSVAHLRRSHNRRHEIADEIAEHLTTFESDLGRALASGSRLVGFLPNARTEANLSATVGQEAISHFIICLGLISKAMESAVDGHHSLDQTRRRFRIDINAGGDKDAIPWPSRSVLEGSGTEPANAGG